MKTKMASAPFPRWLWTPKLPTNRTPDWSRAFPEARSPESAVADLRDQVYPVHAYSTFTALACRLQEHTGAIAPLLGIPVVPIHAASPLYVAHIGPLACLKTRSVF